MNIFYRLSKLIIINLVIFIAASLLIIDPASANNIPAGFGAGTTVATPEGDIAVEKLKKGDRLIGYNFETHQPEENTVTEIKTKQSLSYYLINNRTKITGTSSIYVKSKDNPKLSTSQQLKLSEKLFSQAHASIPVRAVTQIVQPTEIYQIYLGNPIGNLFVDNILVHDGDRLPKLFKKQYRDCRYNSANSANYTRCENINSDNLLDFVEALAILLTGIVVLGTAIAKLIIYIPNFVRFSGKHFTNDTELIKFTKNIYPNFTNKYSIKYLQGNKVWYKIDLQPEIEPEKYQQLISRAELIEQVNNLFIDYHRDLLDHNWSEIEVYYPHFFQSNKYRQCYRQNYQIIYYPKILEASVINFKTESERSYLFTVQINAEMVNFVINKQGYVLTGESKMQQYSQYWNIRLAPDSKCSLAEINDTLTTVIMEGDRRVRREIFGNTGV